MAGSALTENLALLNLELRSPPKAQLTCEQGIVCLTNIQSPRRGSVMFFTVVAENDEE